MHSLLTFLNLLPGSLSSHAKTGSCPAAETGPFGRGISDGPTEAVSDRYQIFSL